MPAEVSPHIAPGALLAERYRVLRSLGGGGMAEVFLAEDAILARLVAVKVLRAQLAGDEQFVERFRREAQAAAALGHPNIVAVYDRGVAGDVSFIVMEYVRGETLKERVRRGGRLEPEEAVGIALQVLAGLQFAHERHIVHRDVTAQNVLIDASGAVKIADFGIARVGSSGLTTTGVRMGTVQYVSPEQARGEPADERADLYSLGVILYEMLAGRLPFTADNDVALALKHANEMPPGPGAMVSGLPPELDRITLKALAKSPDERYQTAAQFAADLRRLQRSGTWPEAGAGAATGDGGGMAGGGAIAGAAAAAIAPEAPPHGTAGVQPTRVTAAEPTKFVDAQPTRVAHEQPTRVMAHEQATVVAAAAGPAAPDAAPTRVVSTAAAARRAARRRRRVTTTIVVMLLAALAVGGFVLYRTFFSPLDTVPGVVGRTKGAAVGALKKDGFTVALHDAFSDKYADGYVVRQTPAAGSGLADGGKVHLWIRTGPVHVKLPDLTGQSPDQVEALLARYDLAAQRKRGASRRVETGLVYRQRPSAGSTVARGDAVAYWVSTGMPKKLVPDVVGSSYGSAKADLEDAGFGVSTKTAIAFGEIPGTVVEQEPAAGTKAREGSVVTIWVALL
jgi:eukaryotic-like serine/threonine-protein kinase